MGHVSWSSVVLVGAVAFAASTARAQPRLPTVRGVSLARERAAALADLDREPVAETRSSSTALELSLVVTALGAGVGVLGGAMYEARAGSNTIAVGLATTGGLMALAAPSLGHWYVDDYATAGLALRVGGGLVATTGALTTLTCDLGEDRPADGAGCSWPRILLVAGAAMIVGGAVHDVATSPQAVRRYNARHSEASARMQVLPAMVGGAVQRGPGLVLAGAF